MADEEDLLKTILRNLRSLASRIWTQNAKNSDPCKAMHMNDIAAASVAGGITFPLCLGSLQTVFHGPLRLTNDRLLLGPTLGVFSVLLSGSVASVVFASFVAVSGRMGDSLKSYSERSSWTTNRTIAFRFQAMDIPLCGVLSLVLFKMLGGRFRSVLPSNLAHPGAFARSSLPAVNHNYASQAAKHKLRNIGRKYGCHSCGKRWRTAFVGDHMPPNKLVKPTQQQRFYPQCTKCSIQQGIALSTMSKHRFVKTHGTSLRLYHLWLPVPIPLMMVRNSCINSQNNTTTDTS